MTATAPALDPRPHHVAVKAVLAPVLNGAAYDYDQVPGSPQNANVGLRDEPLPDLFALVAVERRFVPARRSTGQAGRSSWRLSVRCVGRSVREAQWVQDRTQDALDESALTVSGERSTPLLFESSSSPQWSDGRYSCEIVWTYTC